MKSGKRGRSYSAGHTRLLPILIASVVVACGSPGMGRTIQVPGGTGSIQEAIDEAVAGDTVLVDAGEYEIKVPLSFNGKAITVRSREGAERTTIRMSDIPLEPRETSVVVFQDGESADSVLEGFTLTGGGSSEWEFSSGNQGGGAVLCKESSSPTIADCIMKDNHSPRGAGVAFAQGSSPIITRCVFEGNVVESDGAAVFGEGCNMTVPCEGDSAAIISDCTIVGNHALGQGGAVHCIEGATVTITNTTIAGNYAQDGGALVFHDCEPAIVNCTITENRARFDGGAIYVYDAAPNLVNCTISGNAGLRGGAILNRKSACATTLHNCIVWDNAGGSFHDASEEGTSRFTATYSCIEGPAALLGEGSISEDPRFGAWGDLAEVYVDSSVPGPGVGSKTDPFPDLAPAFAYAFALAPDSPCLGTGEGGVDMGADTGRCDRAGATSRTIRAAAGTYQVRGLTLAHRVSLIGAGRSDTVIEGTIFGLRTGTVFSDLTVRQGTQGGVLIGENELPELRDLSLRGNRVTTARADRLSYGGGLFVVLTSPAIVNCEIWGNEADYGGGFCSQDSDPTLINCTIAGNKGRYGGGICCKNDSHPTMVNCTVAGNVATEGTSDHAFITTGPDTTPDVVPRFVNCIVLGASPDTLRDVAEESYCIIHEDPFHTGPRFVHNGVFDHTRFESLEFNGKTYDMPDFILQQPEAEPPDYRLEEDSPAIDAATADGAPDFDMEYLPRPCGAAVDLGAHEFCKFEVYLGVSSAWLPDEARTMVQVTLTNRSPLEAFSLGVTHDPALAQLEAITWQGCPVIEPLNRGSGPDIWLTDIAAGTDNCPPGIHAGGTVACVVCQQAVQCETIPPGSDEPVVRLLYRPTHDCVEGTVSPVEITGCLSSRQGGEQIPLQVTIEGNPVEPAKVEAGTLGCAPPRRPFRRGDANEDGTVNIADGIQILIYLFANGSTPPCLEAANVNDDGGIQVDDAIALLSYVFCGGAAPPSPGPDTCGIDPVDSPSSMGCNTYDACDF